MLSYLAGAYFFAFIATVLGIVALIFSARRQKRCQRGSMGETGAQGVTGGQGLPIYQSAPITLSGDQLLTLGSVPIPFMKTSDMGVIFLGLVVEWENPNAAFILPTNLAVVGGPAAPVTVICSFPGSATTLQQVPNIQTVFGPTYVSSERPANQLYMLRTLDGSDPTGGGQSTTLTFRLVYTTMLLSSDATIGNINNN